MNEQALPRPSTAQKYTVSVPPAGGGARGPRAGAGLDPGQRPATVDQRPAAGEVLRGEQPRDRHGRRGRVGHEGERVGEGEADRLDHEVPAVRREGGQRREVQAVEDAERDQGSEALPVRRALPDAHAPVAHRDRLVPGGPVRGQVVGGHHAAGALHGRGEVARDGTPVERVGPSRGDLAERPGQPRVAEHLARPRASTVDRQCPATGCPGEDPLGPAAPVEGGERRHGEALFREPDRGRERLRDAEGPVTCEHVAPSRAGARDGDRVRVAGIGEPGAVGVLAHEALPAHQVDGERRGRPARAVQSRDPAGRRLVVQGEAVAPDAGGAGFGDVEHRGHGDRGVRRGSAVLEHAQARPARPAAGSMRSCRRARRRTTGGRRSEDHGVHEDRW